jgi:hypothetical protein
MRKNNKSKLWLLEMLAVWALAEFGYRTYINATYGSRGRLSWPYYAYERNHPTITRLYALTAASRPQRVYLEARGGRLADSVGHLPNAARALVQQLAHDIAPTGSFFFSLDPVRNRPAHSLVVNGPCPPLPGRSCLDELPSPPGGGVLFQLSAALNATIPHRIGVRPGQQRRTASRVAAALVLRANPSRRIPRRPGTARAFPCPIEYQQDLVASKALRAIGLL